MAKKEKPKKPFSTCLEDVPFAEAMQQMLGQQGVGSLCAEMMKRVREKQGAGGPFTCAEMMDSLTKKEKDDVDDK